MQSDPTHAPTGRQGATLLVWSTMCLAITLAWMSVEHVHRIAMYPDEWSHAFEVFKTMLREFEEPGMAVLYLLLGLLPVAVWASRRPRTARACALVCAGLCLLLSSQIALMGYEISLDPYGLHGPCG